MDIFDKMPETKETDQGVAFACNSIMWSLPVDVVMSELT